MTTTTDTLEIDLTNKKIAIFHHFLLGHCKGGGEKLILQMRDHYKADLFVGSIDLGAWGQDQKNKDDFAGQLWNGKGQVKWLARESNIPVWKYIKRQLAFCFSPVVKELAEYDIVIFSFGNIAFVPGRLKKLNPNIKTIGYIHTPPRGFADQFEIKLQEKVPLVLHPSIRVFRALVMWQLRRSLQKLDHLIANSKNIQNRTAKYVGFRPHSVIWPAVETDSVKYLKDGDFYMSHGRLEDAKRIKLIVEAFAKMPDKKLVITSSGPLKDWVEAQISNRGLTNITYEGRVSDQRRNELMGSCLAGIYIPVDEDAGITQCEFLSAGKPVIGVQEGGLLETVTNGQTGILIPANPDMDDLVAGVDHLEILVNNSKRDQINLKQRCIDSVLPLGSEFFYNELNQVIKSVL